MSNAPSLTSAIFSPWLQVLDTIVEAGRVEDGPVTPFATPNTVAEDIRTYRLRDYSSEGPDGALPILVHAPFAGHDSVIADFHARQSLMGCLKHHAAGPLYLTDWKSVDATTQDLGIDDYLADLTLGIERVGGRVHLVGLCQGGWACAMLAARFPEKVASLVLAGAPLDLSAGDGFIRRAIRTYPQAFYEGLVVLGGGRLRGATMLQGFKAMHPFEQYVGRYIHLYEHVEEPDFRERLERFAGWFEHPIDLPGPWYLQAVQELFRDNRLFEGTFRGLGRTLSLGDITCPVYLLAGEDDDITPPIQVHNASLRLGTPAGGIEHETVPGGHVGLFMSHRTVGNTWPGIAGWIRRQDRPA